MPGDPSRTFRRELRVFRIPQIWFVLGMGAIGFGGFFAVYSYVAPLVTEVSGSPDWVVPIVLVLMGIGMTVGNLLGGYLADRDVRRTLYASFGGLFVVLVLLALTAQWIYALAFFVFAVGIVSAIASPAIQTRLMDVAEDNQSIAAALNHSALNIGNSLGALLGGLVIAAGLGFASTAWVGAVLSLAGLGIAIASFAAQGRRVAAPVQGGAGPAVPESADSARRG
jgi:DHA1 family inner membrane transport protein